MRIAPPAFANIAYLRFPRFDERPVVEQAALKERLEARVRDAISGIPAEERIVLDATDGMALVFFGEPVRALDMAQALRAMPGEESLKVGLNHGPIAVTARDAGAMVFGDGLAAAAAAARFATGERLLVTAPFAKMLEATRPDRAAELAPAGEFTDGRVRLHSFYTPEPRRLIERRNRLATYALVGMACILALGFAGRQVNRHFFPPRPAVVEFDVRPRGDVVIDGYSHGRASPLRQVELPPGKHHVQVRNGNFAPLDITVNLEPGERMSIAHTFAGERPVARSGGFWRDLKRNLGF
ncbi:MAG: PEGA domain-containing protein [Betaproteobacteria bacterium]|nr:PEGA domain-containing protein [Betaproteobacteria bacterium]